MGRGECFNLSLAELLNIVEQNERILLIRAEDLKTGEAAYRKIQMRRSGLTKNPNPLLLGVRVASKGCYSVDSLPVDGAGLGVDPSGEVVASPWLPSPRVIVPCIWGFTLSWYVTLPVPSNVTG